nr:hypothetical protein Iba_scaffold35285CG0020 [Ipomoea batatas]
MLKWREWKLTGKAKEIILEAKPIRSDPGNRELEPLSPSAGEPAHLLNASRSRLLPKSRPIRETPAAVCLSVALPERRRTGIAAATRSPIVVEARIY